MTQPDPRAHDPLQAGAGDDPPPTCWVPGPCTRRSVLAATGAVGATVVLAACGSASGGGAGQADTSQVTLQASDVPVGGGTIEADANVVVTQPAKGEFKAFSATCTHQGCTLDSVSDGVIACPCHGSTFDISTGDVVNGPATRALPKVSVSVSDGTVTAG
jgi:Rieske Fe-S protein